MRVLVVGLEDANSEVMIEEWRVVIHAATDSHDSTERIVISVADHSALFDADQSVNEGSDVGRGEAENQTAAAAGKVVS